MKEPLDYHSELMKAASSGTVDDVRTTVKNYKDNNGDDLVRKAGLDALGFAVSEGQIENVKYLVENHYRSQPQALDRLARAAATYGHVDIMAYFIETQQVPYLHTFKKTGKSSSYNGYSLEEFLESACSKTTNFHVAKWLVEYGVFITLDAFIKAARKSTPTLEYLCAQRAPSEVTKSLCLTSAFSNGNKESVQYLKTAYPSLSLGQDVIFQNISNAYKQGHLKVLKLWLEDDPSHIDTMRSLVENSVEFDLQNEASKAFVLSEILTTIDLTHKAQPLTHVVKNSGLRL